MSKFHIDDDTAVNKQNASPETEKIRFKAVQYLKKNMHALTIIVITKNIQGVRNIYTKARKKQQFK